MSAEKNYVDLALGDPYGNPQDDRVAYYKKRGIGTTVGVPGAAGMGSGISHTVYRVPKSELLTRNQVRKIYKNEENAMMAAQAAERAAAAVVRQGEMNANTAGIVYTNEPTTSIDIDKPVHLESLAAKGRNLMKKDNSVREKKRNAAWKLVDPVNLNYYSKQVRAPVGSKEYKNQLGKLVGLNHYINTKDFNIDDAIDALRNKFIETEKEKVYQSSHKEAEAKMPKNSYGHIIREYQGSVPRERDRLVQEHIARKMPKINAVLEKVREGMILGFVPPPPKVAPKEENLLRFENLSSINFSAPAAAGSGAPSAPNDPFAGMGGKRKTRKAKKSKKAKTRRA